MGQRLQLTEERLGEQWGTTVTEQRFDLDYGKPILEGWEKGLPC